MGHMSFLKIPNDPSVLAGEIARLEGCSANHVAYSPDGRFILAGGDGICVWDDFRLQELHRIKSSSGTVRSVAFSPDSRYFISGGDDGLARLWGLEKGREILQYKIGVPVSSLAFSPNGLHILAGGINSRTATLWHTGSGQQIGEFEGLESGISSLAFSPCGKYFVGSDLSCIRMWDIQRGEIVRTFEGHKDDILCVAYSLDGEKIASGSKDKTIRLWDAQGRQQITIFDAHAGPVRSVAFSPDGRLLLSGGDDNLIQLRRIRYLLFPIPFEGHSESVESIAFSPDGFFAISGSQDRTVRLWALRNIPGNYKTDMSSRPC
jgi:WD40 repeat protein